jgi:DNA-binding response OmpR family regulator
MTKTVIALAENPESAQGIRKLFDDGGMRMLILPTDVDLTQTIHTHKPALLILIAEVNGTSLIPLCRKLHSLTEIPILMSAQSHDEYDEVSCLAAGAHDYVARHRGLRSMLSRAENLIRRVVAPTPEAHSPLLHGDITVNPLTREVHLRGTKLELTRTEFELLSLLAANAHRVVHRQELINRVWGAWYGDDHILEVHLSRMRRKFTQAGGPSVGHAIRGVGYRLTAG